ncbi:outer membrane protein assembly factor BamE [Ramlibacter sp. AW1]|uniref:Outer membrane protein assembly factor BamE n=1 Tax=Ramlibacter aurantiacus TaxID=2801330 RepID=A0A936ZEL6_9BURK|nr:outer membrane protein assembly factor BamE [Ramlibacter aurantiacus]
MLSARPSRTRLGCALVLSAVLVLSGCDQQRISELREGVATEADVRARFGDPEAVWDAPGGGRTLEYNRNPAGHYNYMITIGPDGRMSALRQVLQPATFEKIQPGMTMEQVRRTLGKPAMQENFPRRNEAAWSWRWMKPPNTSSLFTVWFDRDWRVVRSEVRPDPETEVR